MLKEQLKSKEKVEVLWTSHTLARLSHNDNGAALNSQWRWSLCSVSVSDDAGGKEAGHKSGHPNGLLALWEVRRTTTTTTLVKKGGVK